MNQPPTPDPQSLTQALWRIYNRPDRPALWSGGGNLPWDDPAFSERMLREHLDESHGAASRTTAERALQIAWLWDKLALQPGSRVLDLTCGPGLYAVALAEAAAAPSPAWTSARRPSPMPASWPSPRA